MTTIISYRFYCQQCRAQTVLLDDELDDAEWEILSKYSNKGICPDCSDLQPDANTDESDAEPIEIALEDLDHIGEKAAQNLREAGYSTVEDIAAASDDELLSVSWVGEKGLFSLKERAKQLDPQKRWNNE